MPAQSSQEALRISEHLPREELVLCGERDDQPIPGFTYGISPGEFGADTVKGKTVIMVMENGIASLVRSEPNLRLIVPSFVNLTHTARYISSHAEDDHLIILCNGRNGRISLEDLYCAGMFIHKIEDVLNATVTGNDGVYVAKQLVASFGDDIYSVLQQTDEGRHLRARGFHEDVRLAAQHSIIDLVPTARNGDLIAEEVKHDH
jgi:2-phosphosulfolactate phosphatase